MRQGCAEDQHEHIVHIKVPLHPSQIHSVYHLSSSNVTWLLLEILKLSALHPDTTSTVNSPLFKASMMDNFMCRLDQAIGA